MSKKNKTKNIPNQSPAINIFFNPEFPIPIQKFLILIPILWGLILAIIYLYQTFSYLGYFGFPLDDPWIHLTFARNLIDYGSFSYFKNEMATSGSTSPIYTLLAALFFIFTSNEFILSYIIGVVFLLASIFYIYKASQTIFHKETLIALLPAFFLAVNPKMVLISVSGMETTLFTFILLLSVFFYLKENYLGLGIALGLVLWTRPDGIILWIALFIDWVLKRLFTKNSVSKLNLIKFLSPFAILNIAYLIFNYSLSGSFFPNTYTAKILFYQNADASYFLKYDVFNEFISGNNLLLFIPFVIGLLFLIIDFFKKTYNPITLFYLFVVGLIAVYYIKMPFAHRFGRYLIPVIPFYIVAAIYGIRRLVLAISEFDKSILVKYINYITLVLAVIFSLLFMYDNFKTSKGVPSYISQYRSLCEYHNIRHKTTGEWLKNNTPENAVIATHDIGAIAFYSHRKIVDMVGLVSPEVIEHLQTKDFHNYLNKFLKDMKIDYLAVLKNWFEVVNDRPIFVATKDPEILEVYKYHPNNTHITSSIASQINSQVGKLLNAKNFNEAARLLEQSLQYDTLSARTYMLHAILYQLSGNQILEETYWKKALALFPGYYEAEFELARLYFDQKKFELAKNHLTDILKNNPEYSPAIDLLKQIGI